MDVLAPLVIAHAIFTDTPVRELAWQAMGWMRNVSSVSSHASLAEAAQQRVHLQRAAAASAAENGTHACLLGPGTAAVLLSSYSSDHAFLCSVLPRADGCACCVDVSETFAGPVPGPYPPVDGSWEGVHVVSFPQKEVQDSMAGCGGWWTLKRRRQLLLSS